MPFAHEHIQQRRLVHSHEEYKRVGAFSSTLDELSGAIQDALHHFITVDGLKDVWMEFTIVWMRHQLRAFQQKYC